MSLAVDINTNVTLDGQIVGGLITGWVLTFTARGVSGLDITKVSTDPTQINILDVTAGTFTVTLLPTDLPKPGIYNVQILATDNLGNRFVCLRDTMTVET